MPYKCPMKIAENRERHRQQRESARLAKLNRVRQSINDWLSTHDGPLAAKVRCLAHWDYGIPLDDRALLASAIIVAPDELRAALCECGYPSAFAARRCECREPQDAREYAEYTTRTRKTDARPRRYEPVGSHIEPHCVRTDVPRASYFVEGFA